MLPGAASHREFDTVDIGTIHAVFGDVIRTLDGAGIPHLVIGGHASAALGQPRASGDIDVFLDPHDAHRSLALLAGAGFQTEETDPHWIFKATRDGVLVDV